MSLQAELEQRSGNICEISGVADNLVVLHVGPDTPEDAAHCILVSQACADQINGTSGLDGKQLTCLNESAWSQEPAVQVTAWRLLQRLRSETWASDLLDMLYLEEDVLAWAKAGLQDAGDDEAEVVHKDTNGAVLSEGDTVTLIKDLKVKGAGFTAKRGTAVRNIHLVPDNAEHIEGRVNDQRIVILTEFVKKA